MPVGPHNVIAVRLRTKYSCCAGIDADRRPEASPRTARRPDFADLARRRSLMVESSLTMTDAASERRDSVVQDDQWMRSSQLCMRHAAAVLPASAPSITAHVGRRQAFELAARPSGALRRGGRQ